MPPPASTPPATTVPATSVNATPTRQATVAATAVIPISSPVDANGPITLTLWTVEEVSPGATPAGRMLRNQLDAFEAAFPNIHIEISPKKASGKGGILDFLTTTQAIVPSRLPDLIVLDIAEVPQATEARLLQPLDKLLPAELVSDFFPFAAQAARVRNHWVAVPFAANVEHMVYNKAIVRKPPLTWDEFTKQKSGLLLPLAGDDAFLVQYLALGGLLTNSSGQQALEPGAIAQTLNFVQRSRELALISDASINLKTVEEVWSAFAAGQAPMAQVSSLRYLTDRSKFPNAQYAPLPTRDGRLMTLANGWAFAVITQDSNRQSYASRFVQWIVEGERIAPWLRAAHLLPATRGTAPLAIDPPDYATFVRDQLEHAVALPAPSWYSKQAEAWRAAVSSVWKGQMTPEEAAQLAASK